MRERSLPKPNTQALSWFYGEYKKRTLLLNPKYQRNPIWSIGQKCFLIDSLISGSPIPLVYINITTKSVKAGRRTTYEVVDGQQRLRAILEFMNNEYALIKTTAKSYPVSDVYERHIEEKYSDLPEVLQDAIWNYPLAVQELRGWTDSEIRALFRRLNYVVEKLSKQELRHSQYFGEFVEAVEKLADSSFWDDIGLFTRRDSQRMKDTEFISELFVVLIDGIQDGQKTLDKFYSDYDVVFPKRTKFVSAFNQVVNSLKTIQEYLADSRFTKRADFYALFAAVARMNINESKQVDLKPSEQALRDFEIELKGSPEELKGRVSRYHTTIIEGPNKLKKRKERTEILEEILSNIKKV